MAATTNPLVWDFYRQSPGSGVLGGVVHYYSKDAQSIWNTSRGLSSSYCYPGMGNWEGVDQSQGVVVDPLVSDDFDLDHPYNGVLFGVSAAESGELYFLRYVYSIDCSSILSSGSLDRSNNNAVAQLKVNLMNIDEAIFQSESTLFEPGAKATFKVLIGEDNPYDMCVAYLDSIDFNGLSETVAISGRNAIGFKLMESTFDDVESITGTPDVVLAQIFSMGGVTEFAVHQTASSRTHKFRPDQTLMSGIEQVLESYATWKIVELPNGFVIVGPPEFISAYQYNSHYVFDQGSVFKRKTKRNSDVAYTKVRVTGRDANDNDLKPVTLPVKTWSWWSLPSNKTYHDVAPDGYTQSELQEYAEYLAESLQYVGVGEDFTGSLRPHLIIGDIAALDNGDGTMTTLGIVTSIKHKFGKSGYITDFSTDSGGLVMDNARSTYVTTSTKSLFGYTRRQTLKDLIQVASGNSVSGGPRASGIVPIVTRNPNATTFCGKTYDEVVAEVVETTLKVAQVEIPLAEQQGDTLILYGAYRIAQIDDALEVT